MAYHMIFDRLLTYDPGAPGIELEVTHKVSHASLTIPAKLDTGSANSIFARHFGEQLGLPIELGYRQ